MVTVQVSVEQKRGCGFRKPGADGVGIYLVGGGGGQACERLPWALSVCPCCGGGIRQSRGFTWINPAALLNGEPECDPILAGHSHTRCPVCNPDLFGGKAGLMWVGEKYYPTPESFAIEAEQMGISKKIAAIPNGFELGTHFILLAHSKADSRLVWDDSGKPSVQHVPGIFFVFRPVGVDLVIANQNKVPERALNIAERLGDLARIIVVEPEEVGQPALLEM